MGFAVALLRIYAKASLHVRYQLLDRHEWYGSKVPLYRFPVKGVKYATWTVQCNIEARAARNSKPLIFSNAELSYNTVELFMASVPGYHVPRVHT